MLARSPQFPRRSLPAAALCALAALVVPAVAACRAGGAGDTPAPGNDKPLRVALVPNQDPHKVEAQYEPLGRYLEQRLRRPVELGVPTGYPAVVEAMANDRIDLALFGGLTYVQAAGGRASSRSSPTSPGRPARPSTSRRSSSRRTARCGAPRTCAAGRSPSARRPRPRGRCTRH